MVRVDGLCLTSEAEEVLCSSSGYSVSRSLLEAYGGSLRFGQDAKGERFLYFSVPAIKPKTILMVDDDADTVSLYKRYLGGEEFALRIARNWEELRASLAEGRIDLVLLDLLMPDEDGWDILQHLKASPETASIPVVVCSVLSQPRLALALGAAQVLQKPIDQAVLLRAVRSLIGKGSGIRGRAEEP